MAKEACTLAELRDWCHQAHAELSAYLMAQQSNFALDISALVEDSSTLLERCGDLILKKSADKKKLPVAESYLGLLAENLLRLVCCPPQLIHEVYEQIDTATVEFAMATLVRVETMCRDTIAHPSRIDERVGTLQLIGDDTDAPKRFPAIKLDPTAMIELAELGERIAKYIRLQAISEIGVNWYVPTFEQVEKIERYHNPLMYGPLSIGRMCFTCDYGTVGMAALGMLFGGVDRIIFRWKWERICVEDFSKYDWATAKVGPPHRDLLMLAYQSPPIPPTVIESIGEAVAAIREAVGDDSSLRVGADVAAGKIIIGKSEFDAEPHHCEIVTALVEAKGHYVTGLEMQKLRGCRGKKISREIDRLIETVPSLGQRIMRGDNRGYRLRS